MVTHKYTHKINRASGADGVPPVDHKNKSTKRDRGQLFVVVPFQGRGYNSAANGYYSFMAQAELRRLHLYRACLHVVVLGVAGRPGPIFGRVAMQKVTGRRRKSAALVAFPGQPILPRALCRGRGLSTVHDGPAVWSRQPVPKGYASLFCHGD